MIQEILVAPHGVLEFTEIGESMIDEVVQVLQRVGATNGHVKFCRRSWVIVKPKVDHLDHVTSNRVGLELQELRKPLWTAATELASILLIKIPLPSHGVSVRIDQKIVFQSHFTIEVLHDHRPPLGRPDFESLG